MRMIKDLVKVASKGKSDIW